MRKWILPEAIEDILPAEAARIESLRRRVLDHFASRDSVPINPSRSSIAGWPAVAYFFVLASARILLRSGRSR